MLQGAFARGVTFNRLARSFGAALLLGVLLLGVLLLGLTQRS